MKKGKNKFHGHLGEDVTSMLLGLIIVGIVVGFIFNFVQKRRGSISVPGISDQVSLVNSDLKVPEKTGIQKISNEEVYRVKKGDNLWDISVTKYGNGYKWAEIAKYNNLANADYLEVGRELKMLPSEKGGEPSGEYVVTEGDSLWKIAVSLYENGYKWVNIWNQNRTLIFDPDFLEIGISLTLP